MGGTVPYTVPPLFLRGPLITGSGMAWAGQFHGEWPRYKFTRHPVALRAFMGSQGRRLFWACVWTRVTFHNGDLLTESSNTMPYYGNRVRRAGVYRLQLGECIAQT